MRFHGFLAVKSLVLAVIFVILQVAIASAQTDVVTDTENCLFCHRYPNMGRYDKSGNKKIFYVNEKSFASSES